MGVQCGKPPPWLSPALLFAPHLGERCVCAPDGRASVLLGSEVCGWPAAGAAVHGQVAQQHHRSQGGNHQHQACRRQAGNERRGAGEQRGAGAAASRAIACAPDAGMSTSGCTSAVREMAWTFPRLEWQHRCGWRN